MPAKKTNKSKKNDSVKLNVTLAVLAALALTFILLAILSEHISIPAPSPIMSQAPFRC